MGQKSSSIKGKKLRKLSEETHFSVEEIQTWYQGFIKDCPTGKLSKNEFIRIYVQFFPQGNPTEFAS